MKILLTSDWHLGKALYHQKLHNYQEKFFLQEFIPAMRDIKPDLLIVAGDILDRPIPDKDTLLLFEEILKELASSKIKTFFILGNHDSRRTSLHKYFLELGGLFVIDDLRFFFNPLTISDEEGSKLNLYFLPYLSPYELEEILRERGVELDGVPKVFTRDLLKHLINEIEIKRPAFLIGHFAISGFIFCGEELFIRGFNQDYLLDEDLFEGFDFLFLGHLHRYQVRNNRIFYPGAPLIYSFDNVKDRRGALLLEIYGAQIIHYKLIELTSPYEIMVIEDTFSNILKLPKTEAFLKIILTDNKPIYEAFQRLKEKFPNLLYLDYKKVLNEEQKSNLFLDYDDFNLDLIELKIDELELFKEFYKYVTNTDPEERIIRVFKEYLESFYNSRH